MNVWKMVLAIALAVIGVALITASVFAYMGAPGFYSPYGTNGNAYSYTAPPSLGAQTAPPYSYPYRGRGCMGAWYVAPSYVAPTTPANATATLITINNAVTIAQNYVASLNNPDLAVDEVEEYTQNFYVLIYEKSTGNGAFEMLIDKYTGRIYPEPGPNMMWNTKYGMMSRGMMGWLQGTPTTAMTVTVEQAKANAQQFLNTYYAGTTVGDIDTFYGYYHVDVLHNGNTYGMLSVNGYTGQVWYHTWHGAFIQEAEL
ncbi:hypothetical protein G4O51_00230 [Candidatus Bathyarchaeota archaeon A05DMB-2]|jgi:hypothetical protein|nr:hypothetical protein [Candidatus Bathyarchaeota archaeon A05DMB-2]